MKLFLVECTQGEYSDRTFWVLGVFDSLEKAKEGVNKVYTEAKWTKEYEALVEKRFDDIDIEVKEVELNRILED